MLINDPVIKFYTELMVEVFKTNVQERHHASMLLDQIHQTFNGYTANFDLQDCDKILRVKSVTGNIACSLLINLLKDFGFHAEVLPDSLCVLPPGR